MVTTIDHAIREKLALSNDQYVLLDIVYRNTIKRNYYLQYEMFQSAGINVKAVYRSLKSSGFLECSGEKVKTTEKWSKEFARKRQPVVKISFEQSDLYDKKAFAEKFSGWTKEKLRYYYSAAEAYSLEGNRYAYWGKAIEQWAKRDELQGRVKFTVETKNIAKGSYE